VVNSLSFVASALLIRSMKFAEPHAENLPPLRARFSGFFTDRGRRALRAPRS
jgi:hypothetical protein